jgi:putative sigma-54 modulation protein
MQLNITGNNLDLTDGLKDHVKDKMSKLESHFDHVTNAHVILRIEKENQIAEATESDMYVAIDHLVGKLDAQIRKHKEKLKDHRR